MPENPAIISANPSIGDRGLIHLYRPDTGGPHPFIIGIHGGGWHSGDQTSYEFLWQKVRALGFAVVLPSYRVAPEFRFPCAYEDLLHLLAWLKENGSSHHLDTTRCILYGASAGGHLAMLLATRAVKEGNPSPVIRGVAQCCGIMDLVAQYRFDEERGKLMTSEFMGGIPETDMALYRAASPQFHIHDKMPPVWMAHGTADQIVPIAQSREMVRELTEKNCAPIYFEAGGLGHTLLETTLDGKPQEPLTLLFEADLLRFFQRVIQPS